MDTELAQEAISLALKGEWEKAIEVNTKIIQSFPKDIDALNRIARANAELGKITQAKKYTQQVLRIDPFNTIASKALNKWKNLKTTVANNTLKRVRADMFLEESGKTKMVSLLNICGDGVLANLDCGDEVYLIAHNHRVSVTTQDNKYIGRLPDDLAARLIKMIKAGNQYITFIKSANLNGVKVFIREIKRCTELANSPSFPRELHTSSFPSSR